MAFWVRARFVPAAAREALLHGLAWQWHGIGMAEQHPSKGTPSSMGNLEVSSAQSIHPSIRCHQRANCLPAVPPSVPPARPSEQAPNRWALCPALELDSTATATVTGCRTKSSCRKSGRAAPAKALVGAPSFFALVPARLRFSPGRYPAGLSAWEPLVPSLPSWSVATAGHWYPASERSSICLHVHPSAGGPPDYPSIPPLALSGWPLRLRAACHLQPPKVIPAVVVAARAPGWDSARTDSAST